MKNAVDVVLCEADFTQAELRELGIEAEIVPLPPATIYQVRPLPERFTVACYMPQVNRDLYRPQEMIEIAKACPDVHFKFFGNPIQVGTDPALPTNIEYAGYVTDMDSFMNDVSALMRFPHHDGLPISAIEFMLAGRYVTASVPVRHALFVPQFSIEAGIQAVKQMQEAAKAGVNQIGADYWREEASHEKYRGRMSKYLGYSPKEYWENRAPSWVNQAAQMPIEVEEVKKVFEKTGAKSVLDIGCGDCRWYPHLKEWGIEKYFGIDISENLIKAAQMRFPHIAEYLETCRVEDLNEYHRAKWAVPPEKADVVFSYTCLQHIKPEDFPKAIEALKKVGKKLLLIEPTNFKGRYYCPGDHDYEKHFKVIEKVELKDKTILLCDLESA